MKILTLGSKKAETCRARFDIVVLIADIWLVISAYEMLLKFKNLRKASNK